MEGQGKDRMRREGINLTHFSNFAMSVLVQQQSNLNSEKVYIPNETN